MRKEKSADDGNDPGRRTAPANIVARSARLRAGLRGLGDHARLQSQMRPLRLARRQRRADELSTAECLDVVRQLAELGTREITLIGGEAYLRKRLARDRPRDPRARHATARMQTGGCKLSRGDASRRRYAAGLQGIGVSIDGLQPLHDRLRGVAGSYRRGACAVAGRLPQRRHRSPASTPRSPRGRCRACRS